MQTEWINDFSGGVNLALPADKLVTGVSPRAFNTALIPLQDGGGLMLGPRPGKRLVAVSGQGAGTYITGMAMLYHNVAGTITTHLIGVSSNGKLIDLKQPTSADIPLPTADGEFPDTTFSGAADGARLVQANNTLFIVTGNEAAKVWKDTGSGNLYADPIGIRAPTVKPLITASGTAGDMTGTFDILMTYVNSRTGQESGRSPIETSTTLASKQLTVDIQNGNTVPREVDKIRVYVSKQETQGGRYYRLASMEVDATDPTITLNLSATDLTAMITEAPDEGDNDVLPAGVVDMAWHLSRMFATDGVDLFYSKPGFPEAFNADNYEPVNPNDGQRIVGLLPVAKNILGIFKERSTYLLVGDSPATWEIEKLPDSLGIISRRSLVEGEGIVTGWSEQGLWVWGKSGPMVMLNDQVVEPLTKRGALTRATFGSIKAGYDPLHHRFVYTLPSTGTFSRWTALPYSIPNRCFEALGWDLGTVYTFCTAKSATGEQRLFGSGPDGVVWELAHDVKTDLAANETGANLYFPLTAATGSSVSFAYGSSVPVSSYGSRVTIIDTERLTVHQSAYSLAGTTTKTATLSTAFTTVPSAGYVVFDMPVVEWRSRVIGDNPLTEKRGLWGYLEAETNGDTPFAVAVLGDRSVIRAWEPVIAQTVDNEYGTAPATITGAERAWRGRIAGKGKNLQIGFIGYYPLSRWGVTALGVKLVNHGKR